MKNKSVLFLLIITLFQLFFACSVSAKKAKMNTPQNKYLYQQKILRAEEIEKYKRSLLPLSGFMTTEEYENLSADVPNFEKKVPPYKPPKDIKMKYVPQPTYKVVHYNDPPGSPELHILRRFKFDRQMVCTGITSPNKDITVYPVVSYYAMNECVAGDLFVTPLDKSLPLVERISRANIIKKEQKPILSTEKSIQEKYIFRTMTPIDFSVDGTKLIVKEKIGNINDGIWKTNLWVYDFNTNQAKELFEIREAIKFYWMNNKSLTLDEKRWDIYPLGFDANNAERIIVSAYGYTGKKPEFLGVWSIDCKGERTLPLSLLEPNANISVNGFKIVQDGVIEPKIVHKEEKKQDKLVKQKRKADKKAVKQDHKKKKKALKTKLKEMKKEAKNTVKEYNKHQNITGPTGLN